MRELDAFRSASRTRCVDDCEKVLRPDCCRSLRCIPVAFRSPPSPFGDQISQQQHAFRRFNASGHENDLAQVAELGMAVLELRQNRQVLHENDVRIRMGKDVNKLGVGDIGPAWNVGRTGQKDPVIADNPLQPVI